MGRQSKDSAAILVALVAAMTAAAAQQPAPAAPDTVIHAGRLIDGVSSGIREGAYVPTILAGKTVAELASKPGALHPSQREKATRIGPLIQGAFAHAYKAGVKIAFGTDSGVSVHGENAREFRYMVEAGMPPMEAILSATRHAADLLGASDAVGSIQPGRFADIIAVAGDPLKDVTELQRVIFVMKGGRVYKGAGGSGNPAARTNQ